ncbi:MAG: NeuD/PglB/VioB family sugar acetyltransferase [Deltaproteobacteria bacterium]|nr:NeuD/PglB/VioB family sugar acetyltransferase [Deltaproteobacteria bacterium]MBN2673968.1 NeuD/PglB/VioB family sugar acetyltransferase [Deltaproteobacteria bacterium]
MTQKLIILGTAGNCLEIADAVRAVATTGGEYELAGFLDDSPAMQGTQVMGAPVLGTLFDAPTFTDCVFVNGIGSTANFARKQQIIETTQLPIDKFVTVIHPKADVASTARLGLGTVVLANSTIGANAQLDSHVLVLAGSTIGHDCRIGANAIIASGVVLCGNVIVNANSYVGAGACVRGGVTIHSESLVGLGSVVIDDVAPQTVVCGNPARVLRQR